MSCLHVCVALACLLLAEARRGCQVPRKESNRQLSYHMMLGTESGTLGRVISLLTVEPFLQPQRSL